MNIYLLVFCVIMTLIFLVMGGLIIRQVLTSRGIDTKCLKVTWFILILALIFVIGMWTGYYIFVTS